MIYFLKKKKIFINHLIIILLFLFSSAKASVYEEIVITGNERISIETIIMFSGLKLQDDISVEELNNSVKKLYETNYFKDVSISIDDKKLSITVEENPIIQSIIIEGVKNKEIKKKII